MAYTSNLDFGPYGNYGTYSIQTAPVKGVTTMPWAAIIPAAASVAGAVIGSRATNKATQSAQQANQQALAYQRQQENIRKAEYDAAVRQYREQWMAWQANRDALLRRYGVDIAPPAASAAPAGPTLGSLISTPTQPAIAPATPEEAANASPASRRTLGYMMGGGSPELGSWNDWSRYGLR